MDLYNYPPLFTRQRNEQTWAAQQESWLQIILQSCRDDKIWRLGPSAPIFTNSTINRTLKPSDATEILTAVAAAGRGEWISKQKDEMFIYWRTPAEIAALIKAWSDDTGHKNTILTVYEVQEGEQIPELEGIDETVLIKAINELQRRGDATALKEDGVVVGFKLK